MKTGRLTCKRSCLDARHPRASAGHWATATGDSTVRSLREAAPSLPRLPAPAGHLALRLRITWSRRGFFGPNSLPFLFQGAAGLVPPKRVSASGVHDPSYFRISSPCYPCHQYHRHCQPPPAPWSHRKATSLEQLSGPRPHRTLTSLSLACNASNKNASRPFFYPQEFSPGFEPRGVSSWAQFLPPTSTPGYSICCV